MRYVYVVPLDNEKKYVKKININKLEPSEKRLKYMVAEHDPSQLFPKVF